MNTIGKLEKLLLEGAITEEEYKEKKVICVDIILQLYCMDIITKEEMYARLNR